MLQGHDGKDGPEEGGKEKAHGVAAGIARPPGAELLEHSENLLSHSPSDGLPPSAV